MMEVETQTPNDASRFLPSQKSYAALKTASSHCHGCELYKSATQTVFGKGPVPAPMLLVGEQPGNKEDLEGEPFVGPAGALLRKALIAAGIDPGEIYLTNAVKHFRWRLVGKTRIHEKPGATHIHACKPWLEAEIKIVKPQVIVCLGATAARALLGSKVKIHRDRGQPFASPWAPTVIVTEHPSAILRIPDHDGRVHRFNELTQDLKTARRPLLH